MNKNYSHYTRLERLRCSCTCTCTTYRDSDTGRPRDGQWRSVAILIYRGTTVPAQCPSQ